MPESGLNVTEEYNSVLSTLITSASRAIDRELGKQENYFYPSTSDGTYYYDGNGAACLQIDDFVSITSVSVSEEGGLASSDYTLWSSSDYITVPYNTTPIYRLEVDTLNGSKLYFDRYRKAVKVIGIRGHSATPPSTIALACKIQVMRWLARAKQMFADNGASGDMGQVVLNIGNRNFIGSNLDPDVAAMLHPYKIAAMGDE